MDFSEREAALESVHAQVRVCPLCALCKSRTLAVPGEGPVGAEIMFVGEAPGAEEDRQGRPFVGASGKLLTRLLEGVGIDRSTAFITSIVKCRPPRNREPKPEEIAACHHYLVSQIKLIGPRVISPLGRLAAQSLIDKKLQIGREHGKARRVGDILYFPMFHPAAALHRAGMTDQLGKDMEALRRAVRRQVKGLSGEAGNA